MAFIDVENVRGAVSNTWNPLVELLGAQNQGRSVCCWALQCAELMGIVYHRDTQGQHRPNSLSIQELIDWVPVKFAAFYLLPDAFGVNRVHIAHCIQYLQEHGICVARDYPFRGRRSDRSQAKNTKGMVKYKAHEGGVFEFSPDKKSDIFEALKHCPLIGVMRIASDFYTLRKGAIYQRSVWENIRWEWHAVMVTGYGTVNDIECYEIKNSWGQSWSNKGYGLVGIDNIELFGWIARVSKVEV